MKILKKLLFYIGIVAGIVILYFAIAVIESYLTEWTLRDKTYDVSYPVSVTEGTISEIEKQVKDIVINEYKYENAYLGEILISTDTDDGFNNLMEGTIVFTYCHKLEDSIIYKYDRFVRIRACVELKSKTITLIEIYGNSQLGGLEKIEAYPEIAEIRKDFYQYCDNKERITKPYTVEKSYVHIYHYGIANTAFTVQLSNGTQIEINNCLSDIKNNKLLSENNTR